MHKVFKKLVGKLFFLFIFSTLEVFDCDQNRRNNAEITVYFTKMCSPLKKNGKNNW